MTNPVQQVQEYGQSIWLDNISRRLLTSGELAQHMADGVLGVTSNPTIFQKAMGGSADYDEGMTPLVTLDPYAIFEQLAIADIQAALDLFRPVYDATGGRDGYVSLEVSPLIADDTQSTISEAQRLWGAVRRPNLMVKIPATPAGIPAIEASIAAGVNVNVTLIFSVANYLDVIEAFVRGLERRAAAGGDVTHIASVASFFLSRIDTAVDRILDSNVRAAQGRDLGRVAMNNALKGKTAIANAKVAYKRFRDVFYGERFAGLRAAGAQVQRLLWASTSTKNPAYPDTLYIDSLIGRDTVNTVPPDALKAFMDHGTAADTLGEGLDDAEKTLEQLAEVGVDLDQITLQLQQDGVDSFAESYRLLLDSVDARRTILVTGISRQQDYAMGTYSDAMHERLRDLDAVYANRRIWEHDGTLWKDHPNIAARINERLGWLDTGKTIDVARLKALQASVRGGAFGHVVLLGMGGSSLAPEVLYQTFGAADGFPKLLMLDSTDPTTIRRIEDAIDLSRTLFIVASKSGSTIETACFHAYFYERTGGRGEQFIAITDPGSQLEAEARAQGFRDVFLNPADIGGRYSALSYFGLVPAALLGIDLDRLVGAADQMMRACGRNIPSSDHPGMWLGAAMAAAAQAGRDKVTIICSPSIASFGAWAEQLVAESTGKEGRGILPVVGATVGKPHDYSSDRLFIYIKVEDDENEELIAGVRALREAGHPRITLRLPDVYALGGEFFRWEYATAIAGKLLDINPFDEPNVTESKQNTGRLLDVYQAEGSLPQNTPLLVEDGVSLFIDDKYAATIRDLCRQHNYDINTIAGTLLAPINTTHAGDYFAIMAYLPATPAINALLEEVRRRLRHVTRRAVTVGYGPRFLHSTGQLHKGGANNGVFIQITTDDPTDIPIPGRPFGFGVLKAAQAAGDLEALINKGRRAVRLHITGNVEAGLQRLLDAVYMAGERRS